MRSGYRVAISCPKTASLPVGDYTLTKELEGPGYQISRFMHAWHDNDGDLTYN